MIETVAGVVLCAVSVVYISTVVGIIAGQRESDRCEFHELITDLRADLDALLDHLDLEITAGWPETEPDPVDDDAPTAPIARAWDDAAADLVAAEPPRTVERTVNGMTFRFREDAA